MEIFEEVYVAVEDIIKIYKLSNSNLVDFFQFIYGVGHPTPVLGRGCRFWVICTT